MKRIVVIGTTLALAIAAAPASAGNTGTENGGPPFLSGNAEGTFVAHCKAVDGSGSVVFHQKSGKITGNGDCF